MRDIIFRGKRVDNGEWVEGDLRHDFDHIPISIWDNCGGNYIIPETVGQYTGLRDCKCTEEYPEGQKIFEGDIILYAEQGKYEMYLESLERPDDYSEIAFVNLWTVDEVVYGIAVGYPAFDLNRHDFETNGLSELNESGCYYYEVIGNIHDNKELLKGGAE